MVLSLLRWSLNVACEPITFLLCLGIHILPTWIGKYASSALTFVGFDITQSHNYRPHLRAPFEGYYTRITTTTGATIIIIFSTVRSAKKEHKPHLLHFSYISPESDGKTLVFNIYPDKLIFSGGVETQGGNADLELTALDQNGQKIGTQVMSKQGEVDYWLKLPVEEGYLEIKVHSKNGIVWGGKRSTVGLEQSPEGPFSALAYLLPLHWFVRNACSDVEVNFKKVVKDPFGSETMQEIWEEKGKGHLEKNWGASFPTGWVWIQSLVPSPNESETGGYKDGSETPQSYVALAGGSTLGLKAFLLGFECPAIGPTTRSNQLTINWTFRPIFTILLPLLWLGGHVSPFCSENYDSDKGIFQLQVVDWTWNEGWRKVILTCNGTPGTGSSNDKNTTTRDYLELPCPMSKGHDNTFAKESFEANILVEAFVWKKTQSNRIGQWEVVAKQQFEKGALEWGGQYWGTRSVESRKIGVTWLSERLKWGTKTESRKDRDSKTD